MNPIIQAITASQNIVIDGVSSGDFAKEFNPRNRNGRRRKEEEFLLIGRWS